MTSAIIETGGKQYRVTPGQLVKIEKLEAAIGSTVSFDKVLLMVDGASITVGSPYLAGQAIEAEIVEQQKGKKIRVFTFKSKKRQRRTLGHRQLETIVRIGGVAKAKTATVEKADVAEKKPAAKKAVAKKS